MRLVSLEIPEPDATRYQNLMRQNTKLTRSRATKSSLPRPSLARLGGIGAGNRVTREQSCAQDAVTNHSRRTRHLSDMPTTRPCVIFIECVGDLTSLQVEFPVCVLFRSQRVHGIDLRGAQCGDVHGSE